MLLTQHLLVGAAIGKYVESPELVMFLAFFSHYILDMIPHYSMNHIPGYKEHGLKGVRKKELLVKSIEPVLGTVFSVAVIVVSSGDASNMALGAFFGFLPDLLTFIVWKKDLTRFNHFVPRPGMKWYWRTKGYKTGLISQIAVFFLACWIIFYH